VGGAGGRGDLRAVDPRPARRLGANPDDEVGDGAHTHPVRARSVEDAGTVEGVTSAYAAKDGDSPYVGRC
jgi:hypothetical protein